MHLVKILHKVKYLSYNWSVVMANKLVGHRCSVNTKGINNFRLNHSTHTNTHSLGLKELPPKMDNHSKSTV